jgi:hypothetical protein
MVALASKRVFSQEVRARRGPGRPGEPEVVTPYSLLAVYGWLQDTTWQIERTVFGGI